MRTANKPYNNWCQQINNDTFLFIEYKILKILPLASNQLLQSLSCWCPRTVIKPKVCSWKIEFVDLPENISLKKKLVQTLFCQNKHCRDLLAFAALQILKVVVST